MARVACFGRERTNTSIACAGKMLGDEVLYFPTVPAVFSAVASNEFDYGFVPAENLIDGPITSTLDMLLEYTPAARIVDATVIQIRHAIGAIKGHGRITRVLSKDTALAQCSKYLAKHYPDAMGVNEGDTVTAIERVATSHEMLDAAAIGPVDAIRHYKNLEVLTEDIGNSKKNKTRFFVIGKYNSRPTGNDTTLLALYPRRDRKRLLLNTLRIISEEGGYNLSSIHSRPDGDGRFIIYMEIKGHASEEKAKECLASIEERIPDTDIHVLGSYPTIPFNEPLIKTIGIIGGTGKMGKFFVPFFESCGYNVLVAGRKTELTYEQCVDQSDAVIINVPIEHTLETIKRIGPRMKGGQLLVDNTGVKSGPIEAMLKHTSPGVEVLSIHTMFGEDVKGIDNQNVISVHTDRSGEMAREFENTLHLDGANITKTTAEIHDKYVTLTQGLEHICAVAKLATILEVVGLPENLAPFSTSNSGKSAEIYERVHSRDPRLFATMLEENRFAPETLAIYAERVKAIVEALAKGDTSVFERMMKENQERIKT